MKIQQIGNQNLNYNTNFKAVNRIAKYGIGSLIAGSSLFMFSNAVDSFEPNVPTKEKTSVTVMNAVASVLSIAGTALGIAGIRKE